MRKYNNLVTKPLECNKKRVAFPYGHSNIDRVHNFLVSDFPTQHNAASIAKALGFKQNKVRSYLSRLYNRGEIERVKRGFYRAVADIQRLDIIEDYNIRAHGITIEIATKGTARYLPQTPSKKTKNSIIWHLQFDLRRVTIRLYPTVGKYMVYVRCTDRPFDLCEFNCFVSWLEGVFSTIGVDFWKHEPIVKQIGLNCDFFDLLLDGAKSIRLKAFSNFWAQLYNHKRRGLRIETHISCPVPIVDALEMLKGMVTDLACGKKHCPSYYRKLSRENHRIEEFDFRKIDYSKIRGK